MKKVIILTILSILTFGCGGNKTAENSTVNTANSANTATAPKKDSSNLKAMPSEIMQADIKSPDGKTFKLADTKDKVLLVNMWATWCPPCIKEMPDIDKLNSEMSDKLQAFSLTALGDDNSEEQIKSFLKSKNFSYQQGIAEDKTWKALVELSKADGIPINFIVTKDGKITKILIGGRKYDEFKAAVEDALQY